MELHVYIAYALAGVLLLTLIRVLWSTSGLQLAKYRKAVEEGQLLLEKKEVQIRSLVDARTLLREANNTLREAIKEKDSELANQAREIKTLRGNVETQRAANTRLNEVIGNQENHIKRLTDDVGMLKEQVLKLRAQMGLEP
jgi:uncharacterized protein YoxC